MKVKLNNVRLAFPELFEGKEFKVGDGKPRYSATFLVSPGSENHKAIEAAIEAVAKETFLDKAAANLKAWRSNPNKFCYLVGDTKDYDGWQGMMALASHRRVKDGPVGVFDNRKDPETGKVAVLTEKTAAGHIYAGCYVNATVDVWAQKGENPGIRCSLVGVQYEGEGDAFSGTKRATPDDFQAAEGADTEDFT